MMPTSLTYQHGVPIPLKKKDIMSVPNNINTLGDQRQQKQGNQRKINKYPDINKVQGGHCPPQDQNLYPETVNGEKFVKTDYKKWLFQEYYLDDQQIDLQVDNISLNFADIYDKVDFIE